MEILSDCYNLKKKRAQGAGKVDFITELYNEHEWNEIESFN